MFTYQDTNKEYTVQDQEPCYLLDILDRVQQDFFNLSKSRRTK